MRTKSLCISVLRIVSVPRVKLASCKSALNTPTHPHPAHPTMVYSAEHSEAMVLVLVLLIVTSWCILVGDLF